jgi:hypothetical protein
MRSTRLVALTALLAFAAAGVANAQAQHSPAWQEVKCSRYAQAWAEALARFGTQGLGQEFLERHEAFLVSGCRASRDVCPRSPAERALADAMTVAAMNAGAASSFPPFLCRG